MERKLVPRQNYLPIREPANPTQPAKALARSRADDGNRVRQAREDGGFRLTGGEQLQNELHRQPGCADDRFTRQDLGLDRDALGPGHALIIHPEAVKDVLRKAS